MLNILQILTSWIRIYLSLLDCFLTTSNSISEAIFKLNLSFKKSILLAVFSAVISIIGWNKPANLSVWTTAPAEDTNISFCLSHH